MHSGLICDICARKRWPCDGFARCSACIKYNFDCSNENHVSLAPPPPSKDAEVLALRERMEKMEGLISQLLSSQKPPEPPQKPTPSAHDTLNPSLCPNFPKDIHPSVSTTRAVREHMKHMQETDDDEGEIVHLVNTMRRMLHPSEALMYFGKSSRLSTMHDVYVFRDHNMGVDDSEEGMNARQKMIADVCSLRPEHWKKPEWQNYHNSSSTRLPGLYTFPDPDLLTHLIDLYFLNVNVYLPLLHRPTFEASVVACLHFTDDKFARILLLVSACGSQWTTDSRVFMNGFDAPLSRGWKWFKQVKLMHQESSFEVPHTQDLQMYSLASHFLMSSSDELTGWMILGIGLKLAQSVGAHRRPPSSLSPGPTKDDELAKRAIWVMSVLDRIYSTVLGRPPNIDSEEMDIDPLVNCDDDHWGVDWTQPKGKPSLISFFNSFIHLMQLLAMCLRTIYPSKRMKILTGLGGKDWDQHIVAELDSALNRWLDQIPEHLRWDPHMDNLIFLGQSAVLYSFYYYVQQTVHRPFIPRPGDSPKLTFPSLAICTNAARCSTHVLEIYRKRSGKVPVFSEFFATASTTFLFLNSWSGKKSMMMKELDDVKKCLNIIHSTTDRSYPAARYLNIFIQLLPDTDDTSPTESPSQKRTRDGDSPASASGSSTCYSSTDEVPSRRIIASNRRIHETPHQDAREPILPTYTDELGQGVPMMFDLTMQGAGENFDSMFQGYEDLGAMHAQFGWNDPSESTDWETLLASVAPETGG